MATEPRINEPEETSSPETEEAVEETYTPRDVFGGNTRTHRLKHRPANVSSKRRSVFNIVDIILFVLLLGGIAFSVVSYKTGFLWPGTVGAETRTIEYTVMFQDVDEAYADSIRNGDGVYSADGQQPIGTVCADVETEPATYVLYSGATGEGVLMDYPGRVNMTVTIRVSASYTEGSGYTVDQVRLAVGATYRMRLPGYSGTGVCIALDENPS